MEKIFPKRLNGNENTKYGGNKEDEEVFDKAEIIFEDEAVEEECENVHD